MNYFVTGATGFIGRNLVEHLLKRDGRVYALVREGSRGRLDALAERLGVGDRLVPVPGDLSKQALGIDGFGEKIDHFFHLAAIYDMKSDEDTLRRANVDGTRHTIEFANSIDVGRFHHTSSIAVAGKFKGLFREDMFDEGQKLPHAYHATKFESEKLAREMVEAPLRIYRPGIVIGNSETGEMDKIDGPYYLFKLLQKLRHALPEWFPLAGPEGKALNIVPVDFVARAMDHIAHMDDADLYGNTFHLVDPKPLTAGQALNEFAKAAHAPRLAMRMDANLTNIVPPQVAKGLMQIPTVKGVRNQILHDLEIPPEALENREFDADFDARDTQRALTGTGIAVPPLSSYATKIWDYWERNLDPDLFRERSLSSVVKDKVIVVTGASSGIGREVAKKIGEAGGTVVLVARTREKLEELRDEVEEAGGTAHVHPADLSDMDDIERVSDEIIDQHGAVDILVNNAGRSIRRSVEASYDRFHDYERTMQLNYFGAVKMIMKLLPHMREQKSGHIINVSSIGVQTNTPRFSAYVASKAALDAFSRCMAPEVVGDGVSVTTVYMPLVRTPMIAPTSIYDAFPTLSPEEAAGLITDAILDKPKRVATRLGTFGQILYSISPKSVDQIMNAAYKIFPDSKAAKKDKDGAAEGDGKKEQEMSTEAVAMAYLLRGVHF
ncbi:MAG TPA: SDR family oxidoreductase [Thermoleophilaceae bacterium]|nr:SDR family oxidoreductase [Thermoleophilaceae bacterium]